MQGEERLYQPETDPGKMSLADRGKAGPGLSVDTSATDALQHELDVLAAEGRSVEDLSGGYAERVSHLGKLARQESGKE